MGRRGQEEAHGVDREPLITVRDVAFSRDGRAIFHDLDLTVMPGRVTVVMGGSGAGKTTLLSLIGGRLVPDAGEIRVAGENVPALSRRQLFALRRRMGMLFQSSALLTDLDVYENVAFPMREHTRLPERLIRDLVLMKLELVGLRGARRLYPAELSGGMARRVALARAIALDPLMVMYDEPFTGLDPISMGVIVKLIRDLNDALGMTSIIVTHDVAEACSIADDIYLLDNGRVSAHGTPAEMQKTTEPAVRQFMAGLPDGPVAFHYPARDYLADLQSAGHA